MIQLTNHILTDAEKRAICAWEYPGEYAVYNMPPYETMAKHQLSFMDPRKEKNFYGFCEGDTFIGFVKIKGGEREVCIAIGIRPDLCGRGYGRQMLQDAYEISKALYPGKPLYLEVRIWNKRAIRCYQKAGFRVTGAPYGLKTGSGMDIFYRMVRE